MPILTTKLVCLSLVALAVPAFASDCTYHLGGFVSDRSGEIFVAVPNLTIPKFAHVTGGRVFPLSVVRASLGLDVADVRDRRILSVGEGYSPLVPDLNARGAFAIALDRWYHRGPFPDTRAGREISAYVDDRRASLVSADARALPFATGVFDLVLSSFVLHHLSMDENLSGGWPTDGGRALAEMGRVLKPGGRAIVTTFGTEAEDVADLERTLGRTFPRPEYDWQTHLDDVEIIDVVSSQPMTVNYVRATIRRR